MDANNTLSIFEGKKIRKIWHKEEWWFSVVDIIAALTGSTIPRRYWADLKSKLSDEGNEPYDIIVQLKLVAEDGKLRETDCVNTEGAFRIIQSIPSPKAEPFKLWLAKVGYERVQEINDPELAGRRMKEIYKAKGYSDEWIEKRVRGINVRNELTDEWKKRGVREGLEFGILTDEISKATFGKTTKQYKAFKRISKQNLRDHMADLELIFSMLGEASTTRIAQNKNVHGFDENKIAANDGGNVAGLARKELEKKSNQKVSTKENFLNEAEKIKRKKLR